MLMLSIVQMILFVVLFGSLIYNLFAKNKHWGFTILFLFFLTLTEMYEDDVLERAMYNLAYDDLYDNTLQQQQLPVNYYPEEIAPQLLTAIVYSVLDGDTIKLSTGETVRLIGLNAPELGQSCSLEAKEFLEEWVLGKEVILEKDIDDKDQYGRLLRHVFIDGLHINYEMVYLGLAHKYGYGSNTKYSSQFEQAEDEAKQNEGCLWETSQENYITDQCFYIKKFHFNAAGDDNYNLNDEYVTFWNRCPYSVEMSGWTIKDETASHMYTLPAFKFQSGGTFTLYTGVGKNTNYALYWGRTSGDYAAIWNNDGDTLFLRDSDGNFVLSQGYSGY